MKNEYRNLIKSKGLKPFKDLSELNEKREVFGVGFDGQFQKGIITDDNRYVKFENEFGGTKIIGNGFVSEGFEKDLNYIQYYKTGYSGLYIE